MNDPTFAICGLLCIYPFICLLIGWWIRGAILRGVRLRSPLVRRDDVAGYAAQAPRPGTKQTTPKPVEKIQ